MDAGFHGTLVGVVPFAYDFTDGEGNRRVGTSHSIWVVEDFVADPIKIKVGKDLVGLLDGFKFGDNVKGQVSLFARNNQIQRNLLSLAKG
jgi:hypothetical protein